MECVIVAKVSKRYLDAKGNPFHALDQVSFTWDRGTNLAVTGESGSGKSTLARLLIGIEPPTLGEITLDGENIARWNFRRWRKARHHIQAVFQDAAGTMDPAYSVYRNMEETLRNLTTLNSAQRKKTILELMELTRMDQHLLEVPVKQLSGGEQRRLSLLRALSIKPDFLVLDEVTSGLDVVSADAVLTLLENYHTHYGCSYLLITHDRQAAYRISDHILVMEKGKIIQHGRRRVKPLSE